MELPASRFPVNLMFKNVYSMTIVIFCLLNFFFLNSVFILITLTISNHLRLSGLIAFIKVQSWLEIKKLDEVMENK